MSEQHDKINLVVFYQTGQRDLEEHIKKGSLTESSFDSKDVQVSLKAV